MGLIYDTLEDLRKNQGVMKALLNIKTEMEDEFETEVQNSVEESYGIPISANTSIILGLTNDFKTKIYSGLYLEMVMRWKDSKSADDVAANNQQ